MENQKPEYTTDLGAIRIADEVVSTVAGLAAADVDGIASLSGGWSTDLVEKLGRKNLTKGIKVEVVEDTTTIDISVVVKFGYPIPEVAETVQNEVKQAVESMTGLTVAGVNVNVVAVALKKEEAADNEVSETKVE